MSERDMKIPWLEERGTSQIGPEVQVTSQWHSSTGESQIPSQAHDRPTVSCFQVSWSSMLATELPGAKVTCGNARPKSEDEKRRLRTELGRKCQEAKEPAQHYARSSPHLKSRCSHSQVSHRVGSCTSKQEHQCYRNS